MKNRFLKLTTLSFLVSSSIYASGYKVPETSVGAVALSAATVAHSGGVDSAYYNPANLSFLEDGNILETDLILIAIDASKFTDKDGKSIKSESELPLIPAIHYTSKKFGDFRFGLSTVVPSGVTKRWNVSPAKDVAKKFTLEVLEINPTISYKINNTLAVAVGCRILHSKGVVQSTSTASRDMEGDSINFGYNLALAYKPTSSLEFGITYRSEVMLGEDGNAKLYIGDAKVYDGGGTVEVPLPALFNLAIAYTFDSKTTLEVVYEKNFWSAYKTLDFNYVSTIPAILKPSMDDPISKDWEDSTAIRVGVTQKLDKLTIMAGLVVDETAIPTKSVSFELPGTDATSVSFGTKYQVNKKLDIGFGMLYSMKESRKVKNEHLDGEFASSKTYIFSTDIDYKF